MSKHVIQIKHLEGAEALSVKVNGKSLTLQPDGTATYAVGQDGIVLSIGALGAKEADVDIAAVQEEKPKKAKTKKVVEEIETVNVEVEPENAGA